MNSITYWQLFAHMKRFLMSRGGDILADDQSLMDYLNFAIQDIFNEDSSVHRYARETLIWKPDWEYMIYESTFPIQKSQKCYKYSSNDIINTNEANSMTPTLFWIYKKNDFMFSWKIITTHKDITKITIVYLKDYEPASIWEKDKQIPLPFRYVPAILKLALDWAAPINLMSSESSTTDFYSHWITRLNKINQQDWLTDYIEIEPSY